MIFPHHEVRAFLLLKVKPEMKVNPQTPSKKPDNKHLFPPKKSPKKKIANNHFKQLQLLVFLAMWKTMLQLECLSGRMVAPHKDISQMVNGQNHQRGHSLQNVIYSGWAISEERFLRGNTEMVETAELAEGSILLVGENPAPPGMYQPGT